MEKKPLRYSISDWHQLSQCLSNNSRELSVHVSDIFNGRILDCLLIQVVHSKFGVLFATCVNARGVDITPYPEGFSYNLPDEAILQELHKFGFFVKYDKRPGLLLEQLEFLKTLDGLHFDKIRKLSVSHLENGRIVYESHLVAFNCSTNPGWINNKYVCKKEDFTEALVHGGAVDLTEAGDSKLYDWNWLDYVANIRDILRDNGFCM